MLARKQLLEHKLQQSTSGTGNSGMDPSARAAAMSELVELQQSLDNSIKTYERQFAEKFAVSRVNTLASTAIAGSSSSANGGSTNLVSSQQSQRGY
jgi:hypothetical protein